MSEPLLHLGDAWDFIRNMDGTVDHIITDPEYGAQMEMGALRDICPTGNIIMFCDPMRRPFELTQDDERAEWTKPSSTKNTSRHLSEFTEEILIQRGSANIYNGSVLHWSCYVGRFEDTHILAPVHPWEKPLSLMEKLILIYTQPGDVVFDPFMGSGRTGEACLKHGRHFVGCEQNKSWYLLARHRMGQE